MLRQEKKDPLESILEKRVDKAKYIQETGFHLGIVLSPEEKKVILLDEEATRKEKEAEEARVKAEQAVNEATQKEQIAWEARQRAILAAEDLRRKEEQKAKEAKRNAKKDPKAMIIARDDSELLDGTLTLNFNPGAQYNKISSLVRSLSHDSSIKVVATGGVVGKG